MEPHSSFDIPLEGLKPGVHSYTYTLDSDFFDAFESGLFENAEAEVEAEIERVPGQFNLRFQINGSAEVACDRCLDPIRLPLDGVFDFIIKYNEEGPGDEGELIYVAPGSESINVAKLMFDSLGLLLPISAYHEMVDESCNPEMLAILARHAGTETSSEDTPADNNINEDSPWRALDALRNSQNSN